MVESPDEHGQSPRVGLLLGVLEGAFPRRLSEDAFLSDEERLELRRITGCMLQTGYERAMDERRRFYLAATQPTETLYAFFPRTEDESEALPSLFLDEVRRCLPAGAVRDVLIACGRPLVRDGESQPAPSSELCFLEEDQLLRSALSGSTEAPFDEWVMLPRFPRRFAAGGG